MGTPVLNLIFTYFLIRNNSEKFKEISSTSFYVSYLFKGRELAMKVEFPWNVRATKNGTNHIEIWFSKMLYSKEQVYPSVLHKRCFGKRMTKLSNM